jgi:hypothetical protein
MRTLLLILPAWLALDFVLVAVYAGLRAHFARTYERRLAAFRAAGHFPDPSLRRQPTS